MQIYKIDNVKSSFEVRSNTFILAGESEIALIDPSHSIEDVRAIVDFTLPNEEARAGVPKLTSVALTHCHFDHWWNLAEFVEAGCQVIMSGACVENIKNPSTNGSGAISGEMISLNLPKEQLVVPQFDVVMLAGEPVEVINTPGHTSCSMCFRFLGDLFAGDLLFTRGNWGRTDLPTGDEGALRDSIKKILDEYPHDLLVHSGHGDDFKLYEWCDERRAFFDLEKSTDEAGEDSGKDIAG